MSIIGYTLCQVPNLSFYKNLNETLDIVKNELPFGKVTMALLANNNSHQNAVIVAIFIIFYTIMCLKEALLQVDILFGTISFACIALEFRKVVRKAVVMSQTTKTLVKIPQTIALYQKILCVMTAYNEIHGLFFCIRN